MRKPKVGDYVTHVTGVMYVCADEVDRTSIARVVGMPWVRVRDLDPATRGIEWALGTEGEEVEALKVAQALT